MRPAAVPRGGRARFRGRLLGKPIPRVGKLVDLQAYDGGRWRTFATTRTNRKGRYRAPTASPARSPRTFRFRARARKEARYPYALGTLEGGAGARCAEGARARGLLVALA